METKDLKNIYTVNLKKLRTMAKLSQSDLSEKAHITEKFYSDIETGKKWGSFETLVSLANALKVEPYELLLPQNMSISYDTKRTRDLMKRLRGDLKRLVDTVEDFLSK